jgi:hypothetical protein
MTYNINDKVVLTDEGIKEMNELVNTKFFACLKSITGEIMDVDTEDDWCLVSFSKATLLGNQWWLDPEWLVKKED